MARPTPEGLIVKAVCQYLALQEKLGRGTWWRVRNMTFNARKGMFLAPKGALQKNGLPDIEGVYNSLYVGFEVKAGTRQSDSQKSFERDVVKSGGCYFVVRSVDDVENVLRRLSV